MNTVWNGNLGGALSRLNAGLAKSNEHAENVAGLTTSALQEFAQVSLADCKTQLERANKATLTLACHIARIDGDHGKAIAGTYQRNGRTTIKWVDQQLARRWRATVSVLVRGAEHDMLDKAETFAKLRSALAKLDKTGKPVVTPVIVAEIDVIREALIASWDGLPAQDQLVIRAILNIQDDTNVEWQHDIRTATLVRVPVDTPVLAQ